MRLYTTQQCYLQSLCCTLHPYIYLKTGNLYFLTTFCKVTLFLPSISGNHMSDLFSYKFFCLFQIPHTSEIIQYWFLSEILLGIMPSRSVHVITNSRMSSFCMAKYIYLFTLVIHSTIDGHLGCYHVLTIVNVLP